MNHLDLLNELASLSRHALTQLPDQSLQRVSELLLRAPKTFVFGVGHSGLISRILPMKLRHVGLQAYTVHDEINPPLDPGDIMFAVSQSGETATVVTLAKKAKTLGGTVVGITSAPHSSLGAVCDLVLVVPNVESTARAPSFAPMGGVDARNVRGAVFGMNIYVLSYALVLTVARLRGETPESIDARHANLE